MNETHLSLGGGGAKIPFLAGAAEYIYDNVEVHSVSGTSSGSLVAYMFGMGKIAEMRELVINTPQSEIIGRKINLPNVVKAWLFKRKAISTLEPLKKIIAKNAGEFKIPTYVDVVGLHDGSEILPMLNDMTLYGKVSHVTASCVIPGVWPLEDGYADGGLRSNLPVALAMKSRQKAGNSVNKVIYCVTMPKDVEPQEKFLGKYKWIEAIKRALEIRLQQGMLDDIAGIEQVNKLIGNQKQRKGYHRIKTVGIFPKRELGSMFAFDKTKKEKEAMYADGYIAAQKALDK